MHTERLGYVAVAGHGLREQKKAETRVALRAATVRLFLERDPAEVTVNDICAAAHVSPRTFFNYFDSKEEPLFAWDRNFTDDLISAFEAQPAGVPIIALHRALESVLPRFTSGTDWSDHAKLFDIYPELREKVIGQISRNEWRLAEALAEHFGLPVDSVYPRLLAGAVMSVLRAAFCTWSPASGAEGLRNLVRDAFDQLKAGLPSPRGRLSSTTD